MQTEPQRCVIFQLDFGIDIGLSLQWSKQIGCWLIQCRRIRADQEEWGWSMHRCLHRPNNVCRDTFKQRPSFSNADVKGGGAARLGHSGHVLQMTFWKSRVRRTPQVNDLWVNMEKFLTNGLFLVEVKCRLFYLVCYTLNLNKKKKESYHKSWCDYVKNVFCAAVLPVLWQQMMAGRADKWPG